MICFGGVSRGMKDEEEQSDGIVMLQWKGRKAEGREKRFIVMDGHDVRREEAI